MNKIKLIEHIRSLLEKDWVVAKEVALATYEAATHEESKPENQYDTRALENSYLAGAQAKRIVDLEEVLAVFKTIELKKFAADDAIAATALVEAEQNGKTSYFFLMPKGGGMNVQFEGRKIQIITPSSPLGEALLGLKAGGVAVVETGSQVREYDILTVE